MYIVRDFYSDEPEPPVRGGLLLFSTVDEAYDAGKYMAEEYMHNRDSKVEGPFQFFTCDMTHIERTGWCMVFESRDYYVWVEKVTVRGL